MNREKLASRILAQTLCVALIVNPMLINATPMRKSSDPERKKINGLFPDRESIPQSKYALSAKSSITTNVSSLKKTPAEAISMDEWMKSASENGSEAATGSESSDETSQNISKSEESLQGSAAKKKATDPVSRLQDWGTTLREKASSLIQPVMASPAPVPYQIPTSGTAWTVSGSTATKTTPSGVRMAVTLSSNQPNAVYFGALNNTTLQTSGTTTTPALPGATNGLQFLIDAVNCSDLSNSCNNLGNITIAFTDTAGNPRPVRNPVLHVARVGGNINQGVTVVGLSAVLQVTSAGATLGAPAAGSVNLSTAGNAIQSSNLAATSSGICPNAGCGSIPITGTISSMTLNASLVKANSLLSWLITAPSTWAGDGIYITVSFDEDFGDAPASYDPVQAASHIIGDLKLGATIDADNTNVIAATTSPNAVVAGADNNGSNGDGADENGVTTPLPVLSTNLIGSTYTVPVTLSGASAAGQVCGWIDFNRNNVFDNPSERACASFASGATSASIVWTIPAATTAGRSYARFRASYNTTQVQNPTGQADSGEVEDYMLEIKPVVRVIKMLNPDTDPGLFNLSIAGTNFATNTGNNGTTDFRTIYHNSASTAPDVTTAANIQSANVTVAIAETAGTGTSLTDYTGTYSCVNAAGATVVASSTGTSFNLTIPQSVTGAGANGRAQTITCTLTNVPKILGYKSVKLTTDADGNGAASSGDTLTWTVQYVNTSTSPVASFQINDQLPSGLAITATGAQIVTGATKNSSYTGAAAGTASDLLSTGTSFAASSVIKIDIPVTIATGVTGIKLNQASATGLSKPALTDNMGQTSNLPTLVAGAPYNLTIPSGSISQTQNPAIDPTALTVVRAPAVSLAKSCPSPIDCTTSPQTPGTELSYSIAFTNNGTEIAQQLIVRDAIPVNTDFKVGSESVAAGTTGLTFVVEFSNDYTAASPGSATWIYIPASGGGGAPAGYDRNVKAIRWRVTAGDLSPIPPNNAGGTSFIVRIR